MSIDAGIAKLRASGGRLLVCLLITGLIFTTVRAADHREAPSISLNPNADLTDVYAFIGTRYNDPEIPMLNVIVSVRPYSEPGAAAVMNRFADDLRYEIHIADPVSGKTRLTYSFRFSPADALDVPELLNSQSMLSYGVDQNGLYGSLGENGEYRNYTQFYDVFRISGKRQKRIASSLATAPPNLGLNVTPFYNDGTGTAVSGAQIYNQLDVYTRNAIHELDDGGVVFAGPREDGFYADLNGIFDLLDQRLFVPSPGFPTVSVGQQGGGPDSLAGFNVNAIALQIPLTELAPHAGVYTASYFGESIGTSGVGVWASVGKAVTKKKKKKKKTVVEQLGRLANPLFNLLLNPLEYRDLFNEGHPSKDDRFVWSALQPELVRLINQRHSPPLPAMQPGGRFDIVDLYIPDLLRVNLNTGPVPLPGQAGFNRLGYLGGDLTSGASSGWPNGRRLGDDVIDIALTALANGPNYDSSIVLYGDNVNANDQIYNQVFPYLGTPHSGTNR